MNRRKAACSSGGKVSVSYGAIVKGGGRTLVMQQDSRKEELVNHRNNKEKSSKVTERKLYLLPLQCCLDEN